ncbi:hypothetical protein FNW52_19815 [Flavobacterium sp. ZT3R18]|uniref:hypothetical protein n=1 Tax=Flavobacterium sp. ZT3R18 TaxID=2594429 RepID=UPI00117B708D|nr:hypothetical protein [Flavobacterium sp. ZT3R18]TRX30651.1 hypothetical protein FNW52_19815 [Flavobacterium sp. ZT3R18]
MKNISLGLVILPLLILSCTTDTIENTESINGKVSNKKSEKLTCLVQNLTPENPVNIYDIAGKLHNDILDVYLAGNYQYNTIAQISQQIEAIAAENNDLMLLNLGTNLPINLDVIQEIVNNPQTKLDEAIANSTMTNVAKSSLSSFMDDVLLWESNPYEEIYQSIVAYESSVIANAEFNDEDKRIILTTSSIVRYSLYYVKERKDEDWDSSIGNRVGGLSGAIDNSSSAVKYSLVTGIMINNLVTD